MKNLTFACALAVAALSLHVPAQALAEDAKSAQPAAAQTNAVASAVRVVSPSEPNSGEALVSMNFDETPLADVIKAFREATGANIISSGTNLQGAVSVRLDNVPWRKGLGSILEPQGLQLVEQPLNSGIFLVTTKSIEIPMVTQTFNLSYAKADDVAKLFTSTIGKTGTATPFPSANVVIVTATEQKLGECEKIIKVIDKPRSQVYIEARFVELSAAASKKLGMKWNSLDAWSVGVNNLSGGMEVNSGKLGTYKTGTQTIEAGTEPVDSTYKTYKNVAVEKVLIPATINPAEGAGRTANDMSWKRASGIGGQLSAGDFSLTLSAFEQMDGVSVFSNPKIIVANEESATVDMTTKEPNVEVQATRSGTSSDQLDITTRLAVIPGKEESFVGESFFSYGITLKVTPRISIDNMITVQIEPSISELDSYYTISTSSDTPTAKYPIIKVRRMKTIFTMQSGTTAVIGGLTRTEEENIDSGIPGLRKLPWIGPHLFGWKSRSREQKEIVIFVTVGVADPEHMKQDVGMPKNAVLSRDILTGKTKEPGDRTKEDLMSLEDPKKTPANEDKPEEKAPAEEQKQPAPAPAEPPAPVEPLLKNP